MATFHSLATVPKTIFVSQMKNAQGNPVSEPVTFTISDPVACSLSPAVDGASVLCTCNKPATLTPITLTLTGKTAEGATAVCGVTFDPDPSIATSFVLTDVQPA